MHIDLDFFKDVNDTFGHAAGDSVLQQVSALMMANTTPSDMVARLGGDEFVILLPECCEPEGLSQIAEKLIKGVQEPLALDAGTCAVSCSIGIVVSGDYDETDAERMLADADVALYAAKNAGRGRFVFYSSELRNGAGTGERAT